MMQTLKTAVVLALLSFAPACSDTASDSPGSTRTSVASLSVPGLAPIPWDNVNDRSAWDGSSVDLQLADAWASCSFVDENTVLDTSLFKDAYLNQVLLLMHNVLYAGRPACVELPPGKNWASMGYLEQ